MKAQGVCQNLVLGARSLLSLPLLTGRDRTVEDPWLPDVEGNLQGHVGPVSPVSKMEMFAIFWTGGTVGL